MSLLSYRLVGVLDSYAPHQIGAQGVMLFARPYQLVGGSAKALAHVPPFAENLLISDSGRPIGRPYQTMRRGSRKAVRPYSELLHHFPTVIAFGHAQQFDGG